MKYLVLISIGPVQEFISAARRCQDLWFGSWLLSELAKAAAEGVALFEGRGDDALIFPGSLSAGSDGSRRDAPGAPSVANKLLVEVRGDEAHVRAAVEAAQGFMQARLRELRDGVFEKLGSAHWDRDLAVAHIYGMMELEWVAVPWDTSYDAARRRAEALLASRKNTKLWSQSTVDEKTGRRPKSALDGQRESVLLEPFFRTGRARSRGVKEREHLCGVGLLKRFGSEIDGASLPSFHSTSHIASAPLRARIAAAGERGQHALDTYLNWWESQGALKRFQIRSSRRGRVRTWACPSMPGVPVPRVLGMNERGLGFDGVLLYPNRLHETLDEGVSFDEESQADLDALVIEGRKELATLFRAVGASAEPPAYYAMILADGDRMGRAIDAVTSPEGHRRFSETLASAFAGRCEDVIEEHGGSLIYAGGDDVLALVPVSSALGCADALRRLFDDAMTVALPSDMPEGVERPTLSVGVAIAHHMEPMDDVRRLAGRAEKLAKVARNSLAVVLSKRSGGDVEVTAPWPSGLRERLETFAAYFRDGDLSHKTPYDLWEALAPLEVSDDDWDASALDPVVVSLVKRVLGRKAASAKAREALEALAAEGLQHVDEGGAPHGALTRARAMASELRLALELAPWIVEQSAPKAPGETAA